MKQTANRQMRSIAPDAQLLRARPQYTPTHQRPIAPHAGIFGQNLVRAGEKSCRSPSLSRLHCGRPRVCRKAPRDKAFSARLQLKHLLVSNALEGLRLRPGIVFGPNVFPHYVQRLERNLDTIADSRSTATRTIDFEIVKGSALMVAEKKGKEFLKSSNKGASKGADSGEAKRRLG